jgi:enamine deaminase RidA (YjgF/YER057c/UK114 family)
VPARARTLYVSGQIGVLPDGSFAGPDAEAQARQALANLETLLRAAGAEPRHLVKLFAMVAGAEHLPGYRAALGEAFTRWFPEGDWPAQSLAIVAGLAAPEILVEVEAVAAVPETLDGSRFDPDRMSATGKA